MMGFFQLTDVSFLFGFFLCLFLFLYHSLTQGITENPTNCGCGTTKCTQDTGLVCTVSENRCSFPVCANLDQSSANTDTCSCGTPETGFNVCNNDENIPKMYCKASHAMCSTKPCDVVDGSSENPLSSGESCSCGVNNEVGCCCCCCCC